MLNEHIERLKRTLISIKVPAPALDATPHIMDYLIKSNAPSGVGYVFLCVSSGAINKRSLVCRSHPPSIIIQAFPKAYKHAEIAHAYLQPENRWLTPGIKCTSLIANAITALSVPNGALAIYHNRKGYITEGTHFNICVITKKGSVITTPANKHILPGCTRSAVLAICEDLGIPTQEHPIHKKELCEAQDILCLSSLMHIGKLHHIEGAPVASSNKITEAIRERYSAMMQQG